MSVILLSAPDDARPVKCDNCEWTGEASSCHAVVDAHERLEPGGEVPSGECPECGALCYLEPAPEWAYRQTAEGLLTLARDLAAALTHAAEIAEASTDDHETGDEWRALLARAREMGADAR